MIITKYEHLNAKLLLNEFILVLIFNSVIGFLLWVLMPSKDTLVMFNVKSHLIGVSIFTISHGMFLLFKPGTTFKQICLIAVCIILGIGTGIALYAFFFDSNIISYLYPVLAAGTAFGIIITYFFVTKEKYSLLKIAKQEEKLKRISLEKENIQANLKILQAQIEPHFLFNTLSTVISLLETDLSRGKKMLYDLTQYLRCSLRHTRNNVNSLKEEMDFIRSYLDINKIRMGARLNYTIEIPDNLYETPFPPMLIQPLVENAIKHAIEPNVKGGIISIKAAAENEILEITISDTGDGTSGSDFSRGIGLKNVLARLKALYNDQGSISFKTSRSSGLTITIRVPYGKDTGLNCR